MKQEPLANSSKNVYHPLGIMKSENRTFNIDNKEMQISASDVQSQNIHISQEMLETKNVTNDSLEAYRIVTNTEECVTISRQVSQDVNVVPSLSKVVPDNLPIEFEVLGYSEAGKKIFKCCVCGKVCMNPTDHRKVHSEARPFVCEYEGCGKAYKCKTNLNHHYESVHETAVVPHKCEKCGKNFKNKYLLTKHMSITCNDARPFVCRTCGKGFKVLRTLKYHEGLHAEHKPIACDICGKGVPSKDHLKVHMTACHDMANFECSCGKLFNTVKAYKDHFRLHHDPNNKNRCDICNKNLISAPALAAHRLTHDKPFACRVCKRGFSNEICCYLHEKKKHAAELFEELELENKRYTCSECKKVCNSKLAYLKHKAIHLEKPQGEFNCSYCEKSFTKKFHLDHHLLSHELEATVPCPKCDKEVSEKMLSQHLKYHDKCCICEVCGASFSENHLYEKHKENHKKGMHQVFTCNICGENFPCKSTEEKHIQSVHKLFHGNPTFNCEFCSLCFHLENLLTNHEIEKHSGSTMKKECSYCGIKFVSRRTYRKHQYDDHKVGCEIKCEECTRQFYCSEDLQQHIQVVHGGERKNTNGAEHSESNNKFYMKDQKSEIDLPKQKSQNSDGSYKQLLSTFSS